MSFRFQSRPCLGESSDSWKWLENTVNRKTSARTSKSGSQAANLFAKQVSDEQSQSSGPVGAERRRAVELGPLVGNGSASAHAAERGHQPGSGD